jgi:sugar O-acyltransferase (sialic acid O-acetyltransferase NeuD family)
MADIVIFGNGEIADLAAYYFSNDSAHRVVAFTVDGAWAREETFCGLPLVPFEELAGDFAPTRCDAFVAIGYSRMNGVRAAKYLAVKQAGYRMASYVSSRACVWPDLVLGDNCLVLEQNNIQPRVRIGSDVFLWSGNHIGHHAVVEDHVFIAGHAAIGGRARIGERAFVGGNSSVHQDVRIGQRCFVDGAALIKGDTADDSVHYVTGTPQASVPSGRLRF